MSIVLLSKSDLSVFNKHTLKYNLADAEKDYFLTLVSGIIYKSHLKDTLVFKGGTAIHHCYVQQTRFSEDLDFTCIDDAITLDDVRRIFEPYDFVEIKDEYISKATIKIERLKYYGPLGLPNSLKIEIDFKQNVVLPAIVTPYNNAWNIDIKVNVMDVREICAEKIRASSDRSRYRDFYDLFVLSKNIKLDFREVIALLKQKEIRKPISKKSMIINLKNALQEKNQELTQVYYAEDIKDNELEEMIREIPVEYIEPKKKRP